MLDAGDSERNRSRDVARGGVLWYERGIGMEPYRGIADFS
jgi:hypothetical protein